MAMAARWVIGTLVICASCGGPQSAQQDMVVLRRPSDEENTAEETPHRNQQPQAEASSNRPNKSPADLATGAKATPADTAPTTQPNTPHDDAAGQLDPATIPNRAVPPAQPLTTTEQRAQIISQLGAIGQALEAYVAKHRAYPAPAILDKAGVPALSWRVELLPYLGERELYEMFRKDEPWNSPHNEQLLSAIPQVYVCPRRFDERTNYLVPRPAAGAPDTAFTGPRGMPLRKIEDGVANTLVLLEVDDALAAPWTQPIDYQLNFERPLDGLGGNHADGFFAVWGGGRVSNLAPSLPVSQARAMFSIERGDALSLAKLHRQPIAALAEAPVAAAPAAGQTQTTSPVAGSPSRPAGSPRAVAAPVVNGPAADFAQASQDAWSLGHERDALLYHYASELCQSAPGIAGGMRWSAALRRPTTAIRFGVSVDYVGPRNPKFTPVSKKAALPDLGREGQALARVTGELGTTVLMAFVDHIRDGRCGDVLAQQVNADKPVRANNRVRNARDETSDLVRIYPGMMLLGEHNRRESLHLARREGLDVLVYYEVKVDPSRSGRVNHSATARLIDVRTGADLHRTPTLNNMRIEAARSDPLEDDPLDAVLARLNDFVEDELSLVELPTALKPAHVAQRAAALAAEEYDNPLPALAELKLYAGRGLLPYDQLAASFRQIVGPSEGDVLAGGAPERRAAILVRWLPKVLPEVEQKPRRNDDDDD
jgi:hypothetical protein